MSSASCTKGGRRQHCNIAPYNNIRVYFFHRLVIMGSSPIFCVCSQKSILKTIPPFDWDPPNWCRSTTGLNRNRADQQRQEFNIGLCSSLRKTSHKAWCSTVFKFPAGFLFHVKPNQGRNLTWDVCDGLQTSMQINSKAKFKNPVIPASCGPEGVGSWCSHSSKTRCSIWCVATWQAHIALQMVARNGKPMQFVFLTLKKDFLVCNFQLFQKLDSTKFIFRTFHFEPWMKMSSCVTDVWREGFLVLRNSPFLAPSPYADGLRSQAS